MKQFLKPSLLSLTLVSLGWFVLISCQPSAQVKVNRAPIQSQTDANNPDNNTTTTPTTTTTNFEPKEFVFQAQITGQPFGVTNMVILDIWVLPTFGLVAYKYKIGLASSTNCEDPNGYSEEISQHQKIQDNISMLDDGLIRLCVVGKNTDGGWQDYSRATIAEWTKKTMPVAEIQGAPSGNSRTVVLDIQVGGENVYAYKYKIGKAEFLNCASSAGYSMEYAILSRITNNISGISDGQIKLCVIGKNQYGIWQSYENASYVTWTKDTTPPDMPIVLRAVEGNEKINLSWVSGGSSDESGFILVRRKSAQVSWLPVDGNVYTVGLVDSNHTIVYKGANLEFEDIGLENGKEYFYAVFAYDSLYNYSGAKKTSAMPQEEGVSTDCFDINQNPVPICTCADLDQVRNYLNKNYRLVNNISCAGYGGTSGFAPIGSSTSAYSGFFEGNNKIISGLYINRTNSDYNGLFAKTSSTAVIQNLTLKNTQILGASYTGSLVGYMDGGTITNVGSESINIQISEVNKTDIGGLIGYANAGTITKAYVTGNISSAANERIGGFVGQSRINITDSYARVDINGTDTKYVGGFVGYQNGGTLTRVYSTGAATGIQYVGGIAGYVASGSCSASFWNIQTSSLATSAACSSGGASTDFLQKNYMLKASGWDVSASGTWRMNCLNDFPTLAFEGKTHNECFVYEGAGTSDNPYKIDTCMKLEGIAYNLSAHYELISDIDCQESQYWDNLRGFMPIASNYSTVGGCPSSGYEFKGSLNGNFYKILKLSINRSNKSCVGLFSKIGEGAYIKNLIIKDANIAGASYTGALAGSSTSMQNSIIEKVGVDNLNMNITAGSSYIGGLIGYFYKGSIESKIIESYTKGYINANSYRVGGFVGHLEANIENSYSQVNVDNVWNGDWENSSFVGNQTSDSIIKNVYATGYVTGAGQGGITGVSYSPSVCIAGFWDTITTGISSSSGCSYGGVGTTFLKSKLHILRGAGWNIGETGVWKLNCGLDYPRLSWEQGAVHNECLTIAGEGTAQNPYKIDNCEKLEAISQNLSAYYELTQDIDCSGINFIPIASNYQSVGGCPASGYEFSGSLNGNNYRIYNLYVSRSRSCLGLFAYIKNAQISNLRLSASYIGSGSYIGTLAGIMNGGNIENVKVTAPSFDHQNIVGGLIGKMINGTVAKIAITSGGYIVHIMQVV